MPQPTSPATGVVVDGRVDASLGANLQDWLTEALATLDRAERVGSEVEQRRLADAVIALFSCRLAAVEHVLIPACHGADAGPTVHAVLARARESERVLRLLEQHLSGEIHSAGVSRRRILDEVGRCLRAYVTSERELHAVIGGVLDDDARLSLVDHFADASRTGPTRPHPYGPHRGRLERAAYRLHVLQDRLRDAFDSRPLPHPAPPPAPKKRGLWAAYALGRPLTDLTSPDDVGRERR